MKRFLVLTICIFTTAVNCCFGQGYPRQADAGLELLALIREDSVLRNPSDGKRSGVPMLERRLKQAETTRNRSDIIATANDLAWQYAAQGLDEKALAHFDKAAKGFRDAGNRSGDALVTVEKAYLFLLLNQPAAAITHCEQALIADASSNRLVCLAQYIKGRSLSAQGLHADAAAAFTAALERAGTNDFMLGRSHLRLAEECIRGSRDADADKHLSAAVKHLKKSNDRNGQALAFADQGVLSYLGADYEKALSGFLRSQELVPRVALLKLIRDTHLKLLSSSEVRNDSEKRNYYSRMYYQYRDSVQQSAGTGLPIRTAPEDVPDLGGLLARKKNGYGALAQSQLEYNKKLNEAELKRLKAEEALAAVNKENEVEMHEREAHIARLQREMAEQELALSRKELDAARQRQLLVVLGISSVAVVIITLVLLSRYRQKKRLHEEAHKAFEELQATHEELKKTQDQLVHSEKMASLGQLTAGIAHEIQNPLNFVNNFSEVSMELLHEMDASSTDEQKTVLANIRQNLDKIAYHGKRADSIIKGMLLHSRNGTHGKQPTDLNQMTSEILQLAYHGVRTSEPGFSCLLTERLDPELPRVDVMPQDFGRVLLNLFSNSFYAVSEKKKAAGNGYAPEVIVSSRMKDDGVLISVRDNGDGIPPAILDRIFLPFFTTKPPGAGTGLGLSISYDIVTKGHGGTFTVDTQPGQYTEFNILLPLKLS